MITTISDWSTFSAALALTLARMPGDASLTVRASGNRFAYFTVLPGVIHTEIADSSALDDGYEISRDDLARLVAEGWAPPAQDSWPNWHREMAWPARYGDFEDMADRAIAALREILKIDSPAGLIIESWVEFTNSNFDVSAFA